MSVINVKSKIKNYNLLFPEGPEFIKDLLDIPNSIFVVDENVWEIYSKTLLEPLLQKKVIIFPINENRKNLASVEEIYDCLLKENSKKNLTLITIGGGILQDITGFVASTLYRGINWIFLPTTLLSQSDSCVGSKTSLNYKGYKNLLGSFFPPNRVIIHTPFLNSLHDEYFYSGLGEIIKLHIMGGELKIKEYLKNQQKIINRESNALEKIIKSSIKIKLSYMKDDEFDLGRRNLLNYGHCFGHAIEPATNYEIPHGQAVVLGMILANTIAKNRGILNDDSYFYLNNNILLPGLLKEFHTIHLEPSKIVEGMKKDKKRTGNDLTLIMLKDYYQIIKVDDLKEYEVIEALSLINQDN